MENLNKLKKINDKLIDVNNNWTKNSKIIFNIISKNVIDQASNLVMYCETLEKSVNLTIKLSNVTFIIKYLPETRGSGTNGTTVKLINICNEILREGYVNIVNEKDIIDITDEYIGEIIKNIV